MVQLMPQIEYIDIGLTERSSHPSDFIKRYTDPR